MSESHPLDSSYSREQVHSLFTLPTMQPSSSDATSRKKMESEVNVDKFAMLFSPSTPRASPTLDPIFEPTHNASKLVHPPQARHSQSFDSDFGPFVSVAASEDPLSSDIPSFDLDQLPPPIQATSVPPQPQLNNSSLQFFDKFARDAKQASERNRKGVLDELLLHEDDPFYWIKQGASDVLPDENQPIHPNVENKILDDTQEQLFDLEYDSDFFSPPPPSQKSASAQRSTAPSSLTRSPTFTAPAVLAPPIASTPSITSNINTPFTESDDPLTDNRSRSSLANQTLSSLSSRWMSSLLSSTRPPPAQRPTLDSIFASSTSPSPPVDHHTPNALPTADPSNAQPAPSSVHAHARTLPLRSSFSVNLSHGSAFGPSSISQSTSPFAKHVYIPPTGAPGFTGDNHDWDKGYSTELEREREMLVMRNETDQHQNENGKSVEMGMAEVIERKSGCVDLRARKASTTPVLDVQLADMIRVNLPALARLPKAWTLLYSLDQHGISLNTLYARCEAQVKPGIPSGGALVVVKDAGDNVFGVWLGDGIRTSRGKGYYGSGESFLWKYDKGELLHIYKWTGKNDYVALCEPEFISFGGGDGHYGLYLDDSLYNGSSAPCPTFGNKPLCSPGPSKSGSVEFECVGLEVWGIGP